MCILKKNYLKSNWNIKDHYKKKMEANFILLPPLEEQLNFYKNIKKKWMYEWMNEGSL